MVEKLFCRNEQGVVVGFYTTHVEKKGWHVNKAQNRLHKAKFICTNTFMVSLNDVLL